MTEYPLTRFHFVVDWGGTNIGFSEVSGLDFTTEMSEYRHGAMQDYTKIKLAGLKTYSNITLKRGIFSNDNEFYDWWNSTQMDKPERRDLTITLQNENHAPIVVWRLKNAWPLSLKSTDLNADDSGVAIETLELCHEGLTMEHVG